MITRLDSLQRERDNLSQHLSWLCEKERDSQESAQIVFLERRIEETRKDIKNIDTEIANMKSDAKHIAPAAQQAKPVDLQQPVSVTLEAFLRLPICGGYIKHDSRGRLVRHEMRKDPRSGKVWTCIYMLSTDG